LASVFGLLQLPLIGTIGPTGLQHQGVKVVHPCPGNCTLDVAANVAGVTVNGYTDTIDLNEFNLTTTGTNTFATGTIVNSGGAAALPVNYSLLVVHQSVNQTVHQG
jgi:hypothetical protein